VEAALLDDLQVFILFILLLRDSVEQGGSSGLLLHKHRQVVKVRTNNTEISSLSVTKPKIKDLFWSGLLMEGKHVD